MLKQQDKEFNLTDLNWTPILSGFLSSIIVNFIIIMCFRGFIDIRFFFFFIIFLSIFLILIDLSFVDVFKTQKDILIMFLKSNKNRIYSFVISFFFFFSIMLLFTFIMELLIEEQRKTALLTEVVKNCLVEINQLKANDQILTNKLLQQQTSGLFNTITLALYSYNTCTQVFNLCTTYIFPFLKFFKFF